jgi:hypothetical protein
MKNNSETVKKISTWLKKINIYWLVITPIIMAILTVLILQYIWEKIFGNDIPENYLNLSTILFLFVMSLSGFAQVLRKEGPGPFGDVSYGFWPILSGYIIIILTWVAAIYLTVVSF